jgi:hypothetical protein
VTTEPRTDPPDDDRADSQQFGEDTAFHPTLRDYNTEAQSVKRKITKYFINCIGARPRWLAIGLRKY